MAKKRLASMDFQFGVSELIPSTQEAFRGQSHDQQTRKAEKDKKIAFTKIVEDDLSEKINQFPQFPSTNAIYVFIIQYFISEREYKKRDVDNMAKTILDILENIFYKDDSQVKVLLVCKKIDSNKIPQNFAYIAIKELTSDRDVETLKVAGIERSVIFYQELKAKNRIN